MATYYISPTGNDTTGDGSSGNPYLTIAKCVAVGANGDTIICKDGTYAFVTTNFITKSFSIEAENQGMAIFDGGGANAYWWNGDNSLVKTMYFRGLEFTNIVGAREIFFCYGNYDVSNTKFHNISLRGGGYGTGLLRMNTANSTINVTSCLVYDISCGGTYSQVFEPLNTGQTFNVYSSVFEIERMIFAQTAAYSIHPTINFKNNICFQNTLDAHEWVYCITNDGQPMIKAGSEVSNNCFYGFNTTTTAATYADNITDDPLFVDVANGNFKLRQTSPCLDTGVVV